MGFQVQSNALCSKELQTYSEVWFGIEVSCSLTNIYNNTCAQVCKGGLFDSLLFIYLGGRGFCNTCNSISKNKAPV